MFRTQNLSQNQPSGNLKKAVFLDRDGTIIRDFKSKTNSIPLADLGQFQILDGVKEGILELKNSGFELVVITNQPDVARGGIKKDFVHAVNDRIALELGINHFYVCYHDDGDGCNCRKPKPGLLITAANDLDINLNQSSLIGDRRTDIAAGEAVGCETYLVQNSNLRQRDIRQPVAITFQEAVRLILKERL